MQKKVNKLGTSLKTGHSAADVARFLGVKRVSVHHAVSKGKAFLDKKAHPLIEGR